MRFSNRATAATVCLACAAMASGIPPDLGSDVQLRAMRDELTRAQTLQLNDLDKPYFISYSSDDAVELLVSASLGGITASQHFRTRQPRIIVRVGSYALDNSNSIFSRWPSVGLFPIDDDYDALRNSLWLGTDALYKSAADQIARKRNALREIAEPDTTADFAAATPVQVLQPPVSLSLDQARSEELVRRLSARFNQHPEVLHSNVRLLALVSNYRLLNSEGTVVRVPQELAELEVRASGLAPDGAPVLNSYFATVFQPSDLPDEAKLARALDLIAGQTEALQKAPLAEEYAGPVLFEQEAAAQMMAEVLADAGRLHRKPLAPPGSNEGAQLESVWAARSGSSVTPAWMTLVDDPLQASFEGTGLAGHYEIDDEGVPAKTVTLVDKGVLKGFLTTRQPVKNVSGSNGHGRLAGAYGSEEAVLGNLFVHVDQPTPEAQMKQKLIEKVKSAGLKYGLTIRRLDFPSTADVDEIQSIGREMQKSGYARTITPPLLAYRVYPDGREELVRGVRFKEFSAKDIRDIAAASDQPYVLNYINHGSAFNFADLGSEVSVSSVICPSLLLDSVELDRAQDEARKAPVVPAPAFTEQR